MKRSSEKKFKGTKPSSFYSKDYFLNADGSMYGKKHDDGRYRFCPYTAEYQIAPQTRHSESIVKNLHPTTAIVLGCARGYRVKALRELGVDAIGVDISEWAIENCEPSVKEYVYCGDVCDLSMWDDKSFDIVLGLDVLEHIRVPDLYTAIDECTRVSTLVYLGLPLAKNDDNPDVSNEEERSHVSVYSIDWWVNQFFKRGFVPIQVYFFNKRRNANILLADVIPSKRYMVIRDKGFYKLVKLYETKGVSSHGN